MLEVTGPVVAGPGRTVDRPVNCVDIFQLCGELAGLDVRSVVPASHVLDCQSVLPYLTNAAQPAIRQFNFTQLGNGLKAPALRNRPDLDVEGWLVSSVIEETTQSAPPTSVP